MRHLVVDPFTPASDAIAEAAAIVLRGGVVAYPTDTLYGLAVDPLSSAAVARLFAIKGRDRSRAIPLVASDAEQVEAWAGELSKVARALAARWWPGPLTLIIPAHSTLCRDLLGEGGTVAVRVPAHAVAVALAREVGWPITSTSANRSGDPPMERPGDLVALQSGLGAIVDAGPAPGGPPSTIVDVTGRTPRLVRAGAVPWDRVLRSLRK